jgi:hypothetical protein
LRFVAFISVSTNNTFLCPLLQSTNRIFNIKKKPLSTAYIKRFLRMFGIESGGKMFTNTKYSWGWEKHIMYFVSELCWSVGVEIMKTMKRVLLVIK